MAKKHSIAALLIAGVFAGGSALFTGASFLMLQGPVPTAKVDQKPLRVRLAPSLAPNLAPDQVAAAKGDKLQGLWSRYDERPDGHPLRFYYFHGNGQGLYRYGKVGWTQTHSFDYRVQGSKLELVFRKRGQRHRTRFEIGDEGGQKVLRLQDDPREAGAQYRYQAAPVHMKRVEESEDASPKGPGNRLWMDFRNYATGGHEFSMYQLNAPAIDGRGIGWFHRGDFDDWSTESLQYRLQGHTLELYFELNERFEVVPFRIETSGKGKDGKKRVLRLQDDPRNFWLDTSYKDAGPSFGGHPAMAKVARMQHIGAPRARDLQPAEGGCHSATPLVKR